MSNTNPSDPSVYPPCVYKPSLDVEQIATTRRHVRTQSGITIIQSFSRKGK